MQKLNPIWLHTFKTLVEARHFTQTAKLLHMTQPGVSQHIKKLEDACGFSLVQREDKRFEPTEAGRLMYQYACDVAQNEKQLFEQLGFDNAFQGECKIACSGSVALDIYPALVGLQIAHPKLIVHVEVAPKHSIVEGIESGTLDLGIVTPIHNIESFSYRVLGEEALSLVLPSGCARPRDLLKTLNELGLIHHPDVAHYLNLYCSGSGEKALLGKQVKDFPKAGFINQLSQILMPVAQGVGFTVLPSSALRHFSDANKLWAFNTNQPVTEKLFSLTQAQRTLPARYQLVLSHIQKALAGRR